MKRFLLSLALLVFCSGASATVADERIAIDQVITSQSPIADTPLAAITTAPEPNACVYYNWGRGRNGWGYCYLWNCNGRVRNGGLPVNNYNCEGTRPSYFRWATSRNGYVYCYQYTPYGVPMNEGYPVSNYYCRY